MTEQTMTPGEVLEVLALVNAASPGPWEPDVTPCDGVYGDGGPNGRSGYMAEQMRDANGIAIFDSLNSEGAMIDEDVGEESVYAWDVVAQKNFEAIAAAMNFFRKHGTAVAAMIAGREEQARWIAHLSAFIGPSAMPNIRKAFEEGRAPGGACVARAEGCGNG